MFKSLKLPKYYENPSVLHIGCEENRNYYIPCAPNDIMESSRMFYLSGNWDFRFYGNPFEIEDFTEDGYHYDNYDTIPVPGCIQMYGYDHHQYTNVNFPFPYDPPYVPDENPTCVYHRSFSLAIKDTASYYLNFEGVDSCFYVYINQRFAGYSQVSHSTSEFDITSFVADGNNEVTVVVLKWCDGSYLEDQDKLRMTGIFRDVYILERPKKHVRDFFVKTLLKENNTKAEVLVEFQYEKEAVPTTCILMDASGDVIGKQEVNKTSVSFEVEEPNLWSAEDPYLYTLQIATIEEVIVQKVGIRCITVKDDVIYINGVKIKFKGVNRHDSDPVTGYTISKEQAVRDLRMMKESNINAIRTSHYPNAPWFPQLCNEYGFYLIGESDLEAHGAVAFYGGGYQNTYGDLVQREMFAKAIFDRNQRNIMRDKNNPCIVMWSMGNEAGYSKAFEDTGRYIKAYDPTRLLHYEGSIYQTGGHMNDTSMLDVYSRMYPPVSAIEEYLASNPKPYVLCEFIHSMGNGPGDIEDYFNCIYSHDRLAGGFVWEWCDHAIDRGITTDGRKIMHYGGDSGEYPHDKNFCVDGMVSPDRIPHPALAEYKNVIRPVRAKLIDAAKGLVELENKLDFTNLSEYLTVWFELLYDGEVTETKSIGAVDIQPHKKKIIHIPFNQSYLTDSEKKKSLSLRLIYKQSKKLPLTKKGHELGFDQLMLKESTASFIPSDKQETGKHQGAVSVEEDNMYIFVSGEKFRYSFNKLKGNFDTMAANNQTILARPLEFNIWRAPIDNDRNIRTKWERAGYHRSTVKVYETGVEQKEGCTVIRCRLAIAAIQIQHILDINAIWNIAEDGTVTLELEGKRNTDFPFLPRFGLRLFIPKEYDQVNYFGYGPNESYIDKHRSSWLGRFSKKVEDMYVDYIMPQENSSHYGCREVTLSSKYGSRISFTAPDEFSMNISRYSQEELTMKEHNYELVKSDDTIVCLDYKMSGVGSNSCGPELAEKYQLCEEDIKFVIKMQISES